MQLLEALGASREKYMNAATSVWLPLALHVTSYTFWLLCEHKSQWAITSDQQTEEDRVKWEATEVRIVAKEETLGKRDHAEGTNLADKNLWVTHSS